MKAFWKGSVSFALVSIPVKLYTAARKKDVDFHLLHARCKTRLSYQRWCPACNAEVPWEDTVHGYEYEKGRFVVVTAEEMEALPVTTSKNIEVMRFVEERQIDPIYYDMSYYLEPVEGGERAYALLREAMRASGRVALSKVSFRNKEHVAVIRVYDGALTLQTLFYADEIARPEALNLPERTGLEKKELELAGTLIKSYAGDFDMEAQHDQYRDKMMELIKAKAAGKEMAAPPAREARKVVSLMDALKKSLEEKGRPGARRKEAGKKAAGRKAG
ncbi:MAG: Ku protein [Thermodesulfovibrionales bacterium]